MARRRDPEELLELYGALKRRLDAVAAQAFSSLEMGSTQGKLIRVIGRSGPISQAELARQTGTDPTLTGRALQTLIERGQVVRERSGVDKREYVLTLGAPGRRALKKVEALQTGLGARLAAALDERDHVDFERIVKKLLAALESPA